MSNLLKTKADIDCEMQKLTTEQLDGVNGGVKDPGPGEVVIVGCTTRPPVGGYPPGTIVWNPWIGGVPHPTF